MNNVILITGTPGVGKTTIANDLTTKDLPVFDIFQIAKELDCLLEYDDAREAIIVDDDCVFDKIGNWLESIDKSNIILEGHYADIVPKEYIRKVFVLNPPLEVLRPRLEERGYDEAKIMENIEAHIMKECLFDAIEYYGKEDVVEITSADKSDILSTITSFLSNMNQSN